MPPGKSKEDKFVFGIYDSEICVGVIDLIRGYPLPDTAMLGLLLIAESHHGRGVGTAAFSQLVDRVRSWPEAKKIRIGVVSTNARVQPFWQRLGFRPTGEVKPYSNGSISSQVTVLELELQRAALCLPEDRS